MSDLKQSLAAISHNANGKSSISLQKKSQRTRKLVVLRNQAAYKQCLHHCKSLGIKPVKTIQAMNTVLLHVHPRADLRLLKHNPLVRRVESDYKIKLHAVKKKSRTLISACASIAKPQVIPWGITRVRAPLVWKTTQGRPVCVAVLDTGISKHPDLRLVKSFSALDSGSTTGDLNGHGTHVAGTIAALRNNFGVVGVAPRVRLYAVQAFNDRGDAFTSDIIQGIDWCIRNHMKVINMSFGLTENSATLRDIIRKAKRCGIVMVASCGNEGVNSGTIDYPARYPETIAVAAATENNKIASYSSRGAGIDIAAPGDDVCSTYLNNSYTKMSGTSMAAPHVTGAAALLISRRRLTPTGVKLRLQLTAKRLKGYSRRSQGSGLLNAAKAAL